jgi:hypothetical protein
MKMKTKTKCDNCRRDRPWRKLVRLTLDEPQHTKERVDVDDIITQYDFCVECLTKEGLFTGGTRGAEDIRCDVLSWDDETDDPDFQE